MTRRTAMHGQAESYEQENASSRKDAIAAPPAHSAVPVQAAVAQQFASVPGQHLPISSNGLNDGSPANVKEDEKQSLLPGAGGNTAPAAPVVPEAHNSHQIDTPPDTMSQSRASSRPSQPRVIITDDTITFD